MVAGLHSVEYGVRLGAETVTTPPAGTRPSLGKGLMVWAVFLGTAAGFGYLGSKLTPKTQWLGATAGATAGSAFGIVAAALMAQSMGDA